MSDILVVEISGKRPGTSIQRPTEKFDIKYPHLIISNNSDDYETDWEIVNVPDDYREWYVENVKTDKAWYTPMNRSYAIKYARENGYRYLVQLDDNIEKLELHYMCDIESDYEYKKKYVINNKPEIINDFISFMAVVLEETNAAAVGMGLCSVVPTAEFLKEKFCYSFFMLDIERCPNVFQGDFEDDIEFRLKLKQMGRPMIAIVPFSYGKISQFSTGDKTGCRGLYDEVGVARGANMTKLYGDVYKRGTKMARENPVAKNKIYTFQHFMKPFKVGILINDKIRLENEFRDLLKKYAQFSIREDGYMRGEARGNNGTVTETA